MIETATITNSNTLPLADAIPVDDVAVATTKESYESKGLNIEG